MPGISVSKICVPFGGGGINWSSYWATLISATVENAAPTNVVLTFPVGKPELLATDITATVNGVARAVSSASWTGGIWTVVLASAVDYADVVVMTFKLTNTTTVTNNVLSYASLLTSAGAGVATLKMTVSADITVTLGANAKFYSDAAGTLDESATWSLTAGALRTIYLKCTTGTATMTFSDITKVTTIGDFSNTGYSTAANAPSWGVAINKFVNITILWITGKSVITGTPPSPLTFLYAHMDVVWSFSGAIPTGVNYLNLGVGITYSYSGSLPSVNVLTLSGDNINWTGLAIESGSNIVILNLTNYRTSKMSSADMVTFLTQLTTRTGTMPATITINDYADYASPPAEVVTAVNTLKATKSITTVNLGA